MDFTKINEKFKKNCGFETILRIDEVKLLENPCGDAVMFLKKANSHT